MGNSKFFNSLLTFFALVYDNQVTAQNKHQLEGLLVVATKDLLRVFETNGTQREVIAKLGGNSIDYDCTTGEVLWSDTSTREVYVQGPWDVGPRQAIQRMNNGQIQSIAVDSITKKLYVADRSSETVRVHDLISGKSAVIVNWNLTNILVLAVDLNEGFLFIQDEEKIIRTDLDGENYRVIHNTDKRNRNNHAVAELSHLSRITVDLETKRLYWVDGKKGQVISMNYQGEKMKAHFQIPVNPLIDRSLQSVTVLDGLLYWADGVKKTYKFDLRSRDKKPFNRLGIIAHFIKAVICSKQPNIINPCNKNNGRCQDLCVLSRSSPHNYKCVCKIGYELAEDKRSCKPSKEFVIFEMNERLRGLSITNPNKPSVDVIDPVAFKVNTFQSLAVDAKDGLVYYTNSIYHNQVHQVTLKDGMHQILKLFPTRIYVKTLAFDWAARNLYYYNVQYDMDGQINLCVLNVDNPSFIKILVRNLELENMSPGAIIVHPNRGYVFFSQYFGSNAKIIQMALDGSNPTVIYQASIHFKTMALDYEKDRLYWFKARKERPNKSYFRHSNLMGGDIKDGPILTSNPRMDSFAINGDFIYAIVENSVIRISKLGNSQQVMILANSLTRPENTYMQVFSSARQTIRTGHPCTCNHKCEKFCFAVPRGDGGIKGICGCPSGEKLAKNKISCVVNSQDESALSF